MLTGKAQKDYEQWFCKLANQKEFENIFNDESELGANQKFLMKLFNRSLIIEWFDSVGLNILLTCEFDFGYEILEDRYGVEEEVKKWYETRELANEAAIKKANEIYNSRNY